MRPLGIPTMHDRAMQALHALALQPLAEVQADGHSYGFRPRRCVADAIKQCFNVLAQDFRAKWVLEGDIKACFDQISHQWLIDHVPMDKTILQRWLKAGFIDKEVFNRTDAGTPQGGIISPILANLALDGLQARIAEVAPKGGKVCFVRYADDFICTAEDPELLETVIKPAIESFLAERGLVLSQEKTVITHIRDGFDFLGFNIRKYGKKLLIKPSKEKISGFKQRLKECIRRLRYEKAHLVIAEFNRRAKGWANFYRHVVSKKVFGEIDSAVFRYLWRELRRRHPKKSVRWVKKKYFTTRRGNHWILFGRERTDDAYRDHYLFKLASCRIRRHIKVIAKATPFDPEYDSYFERREARIKDSRLRDRRASPLTRTRWRSLQEQLELFNAGSLVRP
jgi:RNA-directed DNA polymerase